MTLSQLSQPGLGQQGDNFVPKYLSRCIWKEMRREDITNLMTR